MGNSNGGMHKYTDLTDEEPLYQGGFIWDFADQAIWTRDLYGNDVMNYGGDFGDRPCDYNFLVMVSYLQIMHQLLNYKKLNSIIKLHTRSK